MKKDQQQQSPGLGLRGAKGSVWLHLVAAAELRLRGEPVTVTTVAREAGAHKATVAKVLGTPVHTPKNTNLYKGMNHVPKILNGPSSADDSEGGYPNDTLQAVTM